MGFCIYALCLCPTKKSISFLVCWDSSKRVCPLVEGRESRVNGKWSRVNGRGSKIYSKLFSNYFLTVMISFNQAILN